MASITMTLAQALESKGGTYTLVNGERVLTKPEVIGLAHYPIFSEAYRQRLNGLIFDRYMNCEIGQESVSMFANAIRRRMNENMPTINKLYESTLLDIDPLSTVKLKTTTRGKSEQTADSLTNSGNVTESESGTRVVNQDFPQHALSGNADYASAAADTRAYTEASGEASDTANTHSLGETEGESTTSGYQGAASDLLTRYRDTLINVDTMVLDMLHDCFMLVWGVPTTYTEKDGYYAY